MLFNSFVFLGFIALVYSLYLLLLSRWRQQNVLLLISSYIFYGYWDWRFLSLLAGSTIIDYHVARWLHAADDSRRRKGLLAISVCANLSILGFFKYFNFFADSAVALCHALGFQADTITLNIILPLGISFYTFQTLSYTVDVYRGKIKPARNFLDFALFVSFFPQLVAGPIERASHLLPQIRAPRIITALQIHEGLFLILWGYYKKVVIADGLGLVVDGVFMNYTQYAGMDIVVGTLAFALQIYCDFSGYSDIARGLARIMGFDLMVNFKLPYFALTPSDFWSRWHISLSSWLRDYLYIPLGGNKNGPIKTYRNLFLTMLLGGLWHGASWNFVIWGTFHGVILIIYRFVGDRWRGVESESRGFRSFRIVTQWMLMALLIQVGWLLFRCNTMDQLWYMLTHVGFQYDYQTRVLLVDLLFYGLPLLAIEVVQHLRGDLLILAKLRFWARIPVYSYLLIWIAVFSARESTEFIYFQF